MKLLEYRIRSTHSGWYSDAAEKEINSIRKEGFVFIGANDYFIFFKRTLWTRAKAYISRILGL